MNNEPLYVLIQPETRNSYWADNIRTGIREAAREWRDAICAIDPARAETLPDLNERRVLVVGNDAAWLEPALSRLMNRGAQPIIVNACMLPVRQFRCSGVVFELEEMLDQCLARLNASGRRRTVLLGVNPGSVTDHVKADAFGRPEDIIWSPGRLDDCVSDFIDRLDETGFDSVICANDTVAVCLVQQLLALGCKLPERLHIIGMGNSYVGAQLKIPLTSVMFDYRQMGEAAVRLYHSLCASPLPCHMTVSLPCRLIVRESAPVGSKPAASPIPPVIPQPQRSYFDSDMVQNIIRAEAMLQAGDTIDREILFGIARGETCDAIAERLFFSSRAVRYRIANLVKQYGFENRPALEDAIRRAIGSNEERNPS
ncbi:MAG: substrate-binding domain-containing protein [Clostridia bacterium]|nr:substrate-binding domain-containing protein [Clostridia bacterium]